MIQTLGVFRYCSTQLAELGVDLIQHLIFQCEFQSPTEAGSPWIWQLFISSLLFFESSFMERCGFPTKHVRKRSSFIRYNHGCRKMRKSQHIHHRMHLFPLDARSDATRLRRSYLRLALKYHPDKAGEKSRGIFPIKAYGCEKTPAKGRENDLTGKETGARS